MRNSLSKSNRKARPILSIFAGNLIQGAGIGLGCVFLLLSTRPNSVGVAQMAALVGQMVNMKFGQKDELESDKLGVRFIAVAG